MESSQVSTPGQSTGITGDNEDNITNSSQNNITNGSQNNRTNGNNKQNTTTTIAMVSASPVVTSPSSAQEVTSMVTSVVTSVPSVVDQQQPPPSTAAYQTPSSQSYQPSSQQQVSHPSSLGNNTTNGSETVGYQQQTGPSSYQYSYATQVMPEQVAYVIMESPNPSHDHGSQSLHDESMVGQLQTGLSNNNNSSQRASPQEVSLSSHVTAIYILVLRSHC